MKIIAIVGPTASDKSKLSLSLAKKFNGEIINTDSLLFYKGLNIGTDKPLKDKSVKGYLVKGIPHHLVDIISPKKEFNIYDFKKRAEQSVLDVTKRGKAIILVGGSPLYMDSFIYGYHLSSVSVDKGMRLKLNNMSLPKLTRLLARKYPQYLDSVDIKNKRRIIRALEILENGKKINKEDKTLKPDVLLLGIKKDRQVIYNNIDKRVEAMVKKGLFSEVGKLIKKYGEEAPALSGIGYRQAIPYLKEEITKKEAIDKIKIATRHFAKRQFTWYKKDKNINWIKNLGEAERLIRTFLRT